MMIYFVKSSSLLDNLGLDQAKTYQ